MEDWNGGQVLMFPPPARERGGQRVLYPKKKNRPDQVHNLPSGNSKMAVTIKTKYAKFTVFIWLISGSNTLEAKPRSRSLIRRASRKTKQQIRDAQVDECHVS